MNGIDAFADGLLSAIRSQTLLNRIGLAAERIIQQRTRKGIGADGQPFQPYSEGYARTREKKKLPTDRVNLIASLYGDGMLARLDHIVTRDLTAVEVLINDPRKAEIARYHTVRGAGRVYRPFLDLSAEELDRIRALVETDLDALLFITT